MIVWGIKAKLVRALAMVFECLECRRSEHVLFVFQRYFHLFWIPTLPLNRVASVECQSCKKILEPKHLVGMPAEIVKREKSLIRVPIWMFSGLLLIACGGAYGYIRDRQSDEMTAQAILAPVAGDIAVLPVGPLRLQELEPEDKVGIIRISDIEGDQVHYFVASRVFRSARDAKKNLSSHGSEVTYFTSYQGALTLSEYQRAGIYFVKREK
jgi:hypothetical protein